jgi:hypothetical protein
VVRNYVENKPGFNAEHVARLYWHGAAKFATEFNKLISELHDGVGELRLVQIPELPPPVTAPNKITFYELVRYMAKNVSDRTDVIEKTIRNALVLDELVGDGYGYDVNDPGNSWHRYKSKIPPAFWKFAELEIEEILAGHDINEIAVVPVDRSDSFQDLERGINFMNSGEIPIYKDISFKFEHVRHLWPPSNR